MRGRTPIGAESTSDRHKENQAYYEKNKDSLRAKQKETYREKSKSKKIEKLNKIIAEYDIKINLII
jgi:hypothetical protein